MPADFLWCDHCDTVVGRWDAHPHILREFHTADPGDQKVVVTVSATTMFCLIFCFPLGIILLWLQIREAKRLR